jgi:hypothetical protein
MVNADVGGARDDIGGARPHRQRPHRAHQGVLGEACQDLGDLISRRLLECVLLHGLGLVGRACMHQLATARRLRCRLLGPCGDLWGCELTSAKMGRRGDGCTSPKCHSMHYSAKGEHRRSCRLAARSWRHKGAIAVRIWSTPAATICCAPCGSASAWRPPPQRRSRVAMASAAAASGSRRSAMGTVPAWPC